MINRQIINLTDNQIKNLILVLEKFGIEQRCVKGDEKNMFNELIIIAVSSLDSEQSEALFNSL